MLLAVQQRSGYVDVARRSAGSDVGASENSSERWDTFLMANPCLIPPLNLKFISHFGEMGSRWELMLLTLDSVN